MLKNNIERRNFWKKFTAYAVTYAPFPWDTAKADYRQEFQGKNNLLTSLARYSKVMFEIGKIWNNGSAVIDFGVFPGVLPKVFRDFFPKSGYTYRGLGLMFSPDFQNGMEGLSVDLLETELDPNYFQPKVVNPIPWKNADIVLFLDLIEHLSNPVYALDAANQSLKRGGRLILTTDNITSFDNVFSVLRGRTPLLHPLQTNMFYMGEWRPHFREYAKDDLTWILKNSGFKIIKHEYFDRRQAEFKVENGHLCRDWQAADGCVANEKIVKKIKRRIYLMLRALFSIIPYYRNHQPCILSSYQSR